MIWFVTGPGNKVTVNDATNINCTSSTICGGSIDSHKVNMSKIEYLNSIKTEKKIP